MPSADPGTRRRRSMVGQERATALRQGRAASCSPRGCRAGADEPQRAHDQSGREKFAACQAVTWRDPSASRTGRPVRKMRRTALFGSRRPARNDGTLRQTTGA
jgi:hypothetical protein